MHATLRNSSLCPPSDWRNGQAQVLITKELRHLNEVSPSLHDARMSVIMFATLERKYPCNLETRIG
jgi:hypothetical protein